MKQFFKKGILAFALVAGISTVAHAQLPMTRSIFAGTYTPITTGGGAVLTTIAGDDGTQALLPIGFTFNYLGTNYTTVDACANGWISFNAVGANSWTNSNLFVATTPNLTLAPWWDDLNVGTGSVLYQTQGAPGSQTFTVQWTDVLSYNGSLRTINMQVVLFEGTNVIEFRYGTITGAFSTSESASIGIEGATGGAGNFIDAVSGSSFVNNSYMTTHKWPNAFYRFTPGAPTVLPGGTYTVGLAGTFPNLTEAIAQVNHRGIAGPITLSLIDATYDTTLLGGANIFPLMLGPVAGNSSVNTITIQPSSGTSTLSYRGVVSGGGGNQASATALSAISEPILAVLGTDYVTVRNLILQTTANGLVDRGIYVGNATSTDGAANNMFENITVSLNRAITSTIAIQQQTITAATTAAGANSNNTYRNLAISNTYAGIYLLGTAAFPDLGCVIGNTSPTAYNTIGSATAFDIGGGTSGTVCYGIRTGSQSGVQIYNNIVRNVAANATTDGILLELSQGTCSVYNNLVSNVRNNSTVSTSGATGIRANVATTAGNSVRVYNNFISGVSSAYTGAATATRIIRGIYVQSAGGGVTSSSIDVTNNNVSIDGTLSPNASSTAFDMGTSAGPVLNIRNNNFFNATGAQTAPASHYAWCSTSATLTGNTGSISNYNNLYVLNATQGFVGRGNATDYATLANWQAAMTGQDVNSVSSDPGYTSASDLHVSSPTINNVGTPIAYVTNDIDNQLRSVTTPDIGADEFTPATLDAGATALVSPVAAGCYTSTQQVTVRIRNFAAIPLDFSVNNVPIVVTVSGALSTSFTFTVTSNAVNGNVPLAAGATVDVPVGTINMTTAGTYTFNSYTALVGDANAGNDAMAAVNINFQPGSVTATPTSVCQGSTTTLSLTGSTSTSLQWQESTDGGLTWSNIIGATTAPYVATPTDTTHYRALVCGLLLSTVDTVIYNPVVAPVTVNDTICGLDTAVLSASGFGTLNWYATPTGGTIINTGTTYSPVVSTTTTYYVESNNGGGILPVGLVNNVGGGGQQTSTAYNTFDVTTACTIAGAYVYPGAAGNVVCELRDNAGVLITTRTVAVTAADINQRTYIALNIPVTPGTGYRLAQGIGSVSMFRNSAGVTYPYTIPGVISITGSSAGGSFYYFFYDLQILTGCASPRTAVTAEVLPTAPVTITSSASILCAGDSATFTATSTNNGYTYTWTPSATLSSSTGSVVLASPAVATTYIVNADSAGCVARDTISIGVNALPTVAVTLADTLICIGESDTIMAYNAMSNPYYTSNPNMVINDNATQNDTMNVAYAAVINSSTIVSVCLNITHTWDADMVLTLISPNGTTLDLSSNNGGSADNYTNTCFSMSAATNITAGAAPFTGSFIPEGPGGFAVFTGENTLGDWVLSVTDQAGGDTGILLDWSMSFTPANYSYSWISNPVGFTSINDTITVAPVVTTDYILTVLDSATGCTNTYTQTVVVNLPLTLTMSNDSLICSGDTVVMSGAVAGGDGNYSYSWSNAVTTANDTVTPVTSTVYTLTVMDGCTTPAAVDSVAITVASPIALTSVLNDTLVCTGTQVVSSVTSTGGNGNTSYSWTTGSVTSNDTTVAGAPGSVTVISVTVMDGCASMAGDTFSITAIDAPVATVTSADTTVCNGDTLVLNATASNGDGNYSYSWSNGPTTSADSIVATALVTYVATVTDGCGVTSADSVTVDVFSAPVVTASNDTAVCYPNFAYLSSSVTGGNGNNSYSWSSGTTTANDSVALFGTQMQYITVTDGCGNTSMDSVLVTVNLSPVAIFTESTVGSTVTFTDASSNATSWSWNFGDTQTSTQQNPSHTYTANGAYTVTLIVTNSCGSDTTTSVVLVDVGINDPATLQGVSVYPNPSSDVFNVNFGMAVGGNVVIELFDVQGKLLQTQNNSNIVAGSVVTLNVANYESGMYMLRITSDNSTKVYKLNVQQ